MSLHPQKQTVGTSRKNNPIELFLFQCPETSAEKQASDDAIRLDTLFIGVFHGDEGISGELLNKFIEHISTHPNPEELKIPADRPFGIVPVLNPDGLIVEGRVNAYGVDLNRNFPTEDWIYDTQSGSDYYGGPEAGSEPETQTVIELLKQWKPVKVITVHSPYKIVNYDGPAEHLAEAISNDNGYLVVESIGYPTPGSFGTYCGVERQIPTITLELPGYTSLEEIWGDNRQALLTAINYNWGKI